MPFTLSLSPSTPWLIELLAGEKMGVPKGSLGIAAVLLDIPVGVEETGQLESFFDDDGEFRWGLTFTLLSKHQHHSKRPRGSLDYWKPLGTWVLRIDDALDVMDEPTRKQFESLLPGEGPTEPLIAYIRENQREGLLR